MRDRGVNAHLAKCLNSVLNVKALVAAFNQEKALVGAFSVITKLWMDLFEALVDTTLCSVCHLVVQPGAVSEAHLQGGGAHDPVGGGAQHAHHRHQVVPGQISRYIYLSRPGYLSMAGTRWLLATLFSLNVT